MGFDCEIEQVVQMQYSVAPVRADRIGETLAADPRICAQTLNRSHAGSQPRSDPAEARGLWARVCARHSLTPTRRSLLPAGFCSVDRSQSQQRRSLRRRHAAQPRDVNSLVTAIAAVRVQTATATRIPQPNCPVKAAAG